MHGNDRVQRLLNADETYPLMIEAINRARSTIHWANFCYERGKAFERFFEPLSRAAQRGVNVRLLVDAYGSSDLSPTARNRLTQAGLQVIVYQPFQASKFWLYNRRLHQKLLIVDNKIGFTGGIGVADYWLSPSDYPKSWRDTHFRLAGPIVAALQGAFIHSWNQFAPQRLPVPTRPPRSSSFAPIESRSRGGRITAVGQAMIALLESANQEINITTAYFSPNRALRSALIQSSRRGINVRVLTNGPHFTHRIARDAGRSFYTKLLRSGVKLFEYQPTKIHAKIITADGRFGLIGSANLNFRSVYHDREFNLVFRDADLAAQLNRDFERDLKKAQAVSLNDIASLPTSVKIRQVAAGLGRYFF